MDDTLINEMNNVYTQYLNDESHTVGNAESISFPTSENDIRKILDYVKSNGQTVTTQGARTGITAGAVPNGGHIINLSRMNKITALRYDESKKCFILSVQPGVLLSEVRKALENQDFDISNWSESSINALGKMQKSGKWIFTPDPTESSASIGGMASCNASGARSFHYGPTRNYIDAIHVILSDGSFITLKRDEQKAKGFDFSVKTDDGKVIKGTLPDYSMPNVKNASGYYIKKDMDILDLFIGSEGTLGIITELELRLIPSPSFVWGVMAFFHSENNAIDFVKLIRKAGLKSNPAAIEYFNEKALNLFRKQKKVTKAFSQIQDLKPGYNTAIYVELHGQSFEEMKNAVLKTGEIITSCGGNEKDTWLATDSINLDKLLSLRHAIPESVNMLIGLRKKDNPKITKLGTDMAVPDNELSNIVKFYNKEINKSGLEAVMFGHIGNNHIHVNILPNSIEDYTKGKELYMKWAHHVVNIGGTVSAEHGIGKMKTPMLLDMYGKDGIDKMKKIKKIFDPYNILNPGNIFNQDKSR